VAPATSNGVTTVVTKLFTSSLRTWRISGQRRQQGDRDPAIVRDLDIPVRIEVCRTRRSPTAWRCQAGSAALPTERLRATALHRALAAAAPVAAGERDPADRGRDCAAHSSKLPDRPEVLELVSTKPRSVTRIDGEVLP